MRIRSVHSTHPPSLRRVQMHYLGRLASNGRILCPHSKAKLYIFRVAFPLFCLLRALPPMRNVFSCILERPLHPFRWSRQKFWRRHRAQHRPTPFKLVFYCRVPFPVFPRHYSPRLFHHPFRPSFALSRWCRYDSHLTRMEGAIYMGQISGAWQSAVVIE